MNRFQRLLCACVLAWGVLAIAASAASATTFYVNQRGEVGPCAKPGKPACLTIKEAIVQAEKTPGPNTIEVEPETGETTVYKETIELKSSKDNGLTIHGEEPGVVIQDTGTPAIAVQAPAGAVTLSNLSIKTIGAKATVSDAGGELTLTDDMIESESGENGVEATTHGSLSILDTSILMESGSSKYAVSAKETPLVLNGVKIINGGESEAEAGGILSRLSSLSVANTQIAVESGTKPTEFGLVAEKDSSVSLQEVTVKQNSPVIGVILEESSATVNGLRVEMVNPSDKVEAVLSEDPGGSSTFSHLEIDGTWTGPALEAFGGNLTLSDSHLIASSSSEAPALKYGGFESSTGLFVQHSVLQAAASAKPGAVLAEEGNATMDSSEILGGRNAVYFESRMAPVSKLTLSASTLDAGAPGISADAAGVSGVEAAAKDGPGSGANVAIQNSIVLETQVSTTAAGDQASIGCSYSAVPSQSQAASGGTGTISCASGSSGNTEVNPLSSLFSEPLTNYQLNPSSSAVDSVPASAIVLPFGLTPSATDLAGNPRVTDGNGDCVAVQDKGALELQGHSASCPAAMSPTTVKSPPLLVLKPSITALKLSPSSFLPAPSGATSAKGKGKKKQKFGTTISYIDSQAATTTFTVVSEAKGRRQGKTCKKPSKANKHGKPCKLIVKHGNFVHVDTAGANSLRFSGRLKGKALTKGIYKLQAAPRNAAGSGLTVSKSFTIK